LEIRTIPPAKDAGAKGAVCQTYKTHLNITDEARLACTKHNKGKNAPFDVALLQPRVLYTYKVYFQADDSQSQGSLATRHHVLLPVCSHPTVFQTLEIRQRRYRQAHSTRV
jgi:hypothetical protein